MFFYFLGGLIFLSYGQYFWKRYIFKKRVKTSDKVVQTIVETVSKVDITRPSSPMSIASNCSENAYFFADYQLRL